MRLSTAILIPAVALAAVWARAALPPDVSARTTTAPSADAARDGLALRLAEAGAPPLAGLSAQVDPDGVWLLRGRAARHSGGAAGLPAAFYAEAERICDVRLAEASCWRLTLLEIDGRPKPVAGDVR